MRDAQQLLEDLERRALPFSRSNDPSLPYMLHPLVREFLLTRVQQEGRAIVDAHAKRALDWMLANQRVAAAIDLSLDIGDIDGAASLIDRYSRMEARHFGRHATFLYWCNKLTAEQLHRYPKIQCIRVWSLNVIRRYSEADGILHGLEERLSARTSADEAHCSVARAVELERYIQLTLRDQWVGLAAKTRSWLARWPQEDKLDLGVAHVLIGCGLISSSDFDGALENLRLGQRYWREINAYYVGAWADMWAVTTLAKQGNFRQALYECDEAISEVESHLGGQTSAEIMLQAIRGFLLYEMNCLDEAGAALEHGLTALVEQCSVDSLIMGYVALARLQNAQGSQMEALETLAEGEVLGWAHNLPRLAIALAAERIDMLLRQGELNQALGLWEQLKRSSSARATRDFDNALRDKSGRIDTRVALMRGDARHALELICPALQHASETRQKRKQVELLLLKAIATDAQAGREVAFVVIQEAVDIAMTEGYIRLFADEGLKAKALLGSFVDSRPRNSTSPAMAAYLQQISAAFERPVMTLEPSALQALDALTARERKVLAKLQSGLSNRELADVLFVTEGTLKWHLRNIYSKLRVPNRLAAVAMARQSGLIKEDKPEGGEI